MPRLYRLPRFHSNLVSQRPSNINNIEALRSIYPNLYNEFETKEDEDSSESLSYYKQYLFNPTSNKVNQANPVYSTKQQDSSFLKNNEKIKRSAENLNQFVEIQDYGSETRDFIISCLEKSLNSKIVTNRSSLQNQSIQPENQPCSSNQAYVEQKKVDEFNRHLLKSNTIKEHKLPNTTSPPNSENVVEATSNDQKQSVTSPKSPIKSRLPTLVKDYGHKKNIVQSCVSSRSAKERTISISPRPRTAESVQYRRITKSNTRWFNENKLQFTKKMTSYVFTSHDMNGGKSIKNNSNDFFGYTI